MLFSSSSLARNVFENFFVISEEFCVTEDIIIGTQLSSSYHKCRYLGESIYLANTEHFSTFRQSIPLPENMGEEIELIIEKGVQQPVVSPRNSTLGSYAVKDHFSLKNPSSSLQFGENENVVFTVGQSQIVLERNLENNNVIAKEIDLEAPGLFVLRGFYTLIAFLFAGFMFVFCTQLILSLFLGFKTDAGLGSNDDDTYNFSILGFVGTLFAIPAFTRGMANDMTLASAFVADTWKSNEFMMTMVAWNSVTINWLSTIVYVLVPFFVGGIFLSIGSDDWWKYTLLTWYVLNVFNFILKCFHI